MIGLSFMTFRAIDVLLYRSKKMVGISCTISAISLCPLLFWPAQCTAGGHGLAM
jgi:hypothetical protein